MQPATETSVPTTYDKELNIHFAAISPPLAAVNVTVHIEKFRDHTELLEMFLYHFDVDSNCIEFAFGEKLKMHDDRRSVSYTTDPDIHVPPFRIQIAHQPATADLSEYAFTISWELAY